MASHRGRVCGIVALSLGATGLLSPRANAAELGLGLMAAVGGNFQDKPDRRSFDPDLNPGFGGLTAGGGFIIDGRILDLLGLEVDVLRTTDKGTGNVTVTEATPFGPISGTDKVTIGQAAWHIPILAKVTIPSPIVAPEFFLGPEVVLPSSGSVHLDGPINGNVHCKADTYWMITGGGGVEIKVPLPIIDLRIPITLRASYNPGLSSKFADRTKLNVANQSITYDSAWKYAINFTAGAAIYF